MRDSSHIPAATALGDDMPDAYSGAGGAGSATRSRMRPGRLPVALPLLLLALIAWALGTMLTWTVVQRDAQLRDSLQAARIARAAEGLMRQYELLLNLSRTVFDPGMDSPGLGIRALVFGDLVQRDHEGVVSVSFIRRVEQQRLQAYADALRRSVPLSDDGMPSSALQPLPGRPVHYFLESMLPVEVPAALRGVDMQRDAQVDAAMRRSLAENAPVILAHSMAGFSSMSAPVLIAPAWNQVARDRSSGLLGFVVMRLDTGAQLRDVIVRELPPGWALLLELEPEPTSANSPAMPGARLLEHDPEGTGRQARADGRVATESMVFKVGASRLRLTVNSDGALDQGAWSTFALGSLVSLLLASLLAAVLDRANRRRAMAVDYAQGRDRSARVLEGRLRDIVESSRDWIWETDAQGRFTYLSPNTIDILGHPPSSLLGTPASALEENPEPGATGHAGTRERVLLHRDGRRIAMESSSVQVLDDAGAPAGWRGIDRDISTRRVVQDRLSRLRQDIAQSTRSNLAAQLLSGVAHELNQPLAAIAAYNQACMRLLRSGTADMDEIMRAMEASANSAVLAGDVLKRLRAVSGAGELMAEAVGVRDIVDNALALLDYRINQSRTRVDVGLEPGLPRLYADPVLLLQVVLNVLNNALDAVSQVPEPRISIAARRGPDGDVEISVSDNGPGIDPAMREQVLESAFTTKLHGSGLGLPISRSIAEAHDGALAIEEAPGGGTRVVLTMRAAAD